MQRDRVWLQVELAAATYELPRLKRMWTHLERQAGGGQVKGMGEKQKEVDKRLLRCVPAAAPLRRCVEGRHVDCAPWCVQNYFDPLTSRWAGPVSTTP